MLLELPDASQPLSLDDYRRADRTTLGRAGHGSHIVQFYDGGGALADAVGGYLMAGRGAGEPVVVIATEAHNELFARRLRDHGLDVEEARRNGRLTMLDARTTL